MPVRSRTSRRSFPPLGAVLGFALSLALTVSATLAHAAIWTSSSGARLFAELVSQCPFLISTGYPAHGVWIPFLFNVAAVALSVAFFDIWHHYRDWTWRTLIWLLLVTLIAGTVHAAAGIPVRFR